MRWRFVFWKTEAKLLCGVLLEALSVALFVTFLVAEITAFFTFVYGESLGTFFKITGAGAAIAFVAALCRNLWSELDDICDEPIREPLSAYPELESMVRDVAREMNRPAPDSVAFLLSPIAWRRFGSDSVRLRDQREIAIPVSCLAIWSIRGLRCHISHALVRRHPKAWLFFAVRKSLIRLRSEVRGRGLFLRSIIMPQAMVRFYWKFLGFWNMFADVEADARIARVLGDSAVATWICQTQLAGLIVPI